MPCAARSSPEPVTSSKWLDAAGRRARGLSEVAPAALAAWGMYDGEAPAAWRWEAYVRENFDLGTTPFAAISLADRLGEVEYNVGMDYRKTTYGDPGVISRYDGDGTLLMVRDDADRATLGDDAVTRRGGGARHGTGTPSLARSDAAVIYDFN